MLFLRHSVDCSSKSLGLFRPQQQSRISLVDTKTQWRSSLSSKWRPRYVCGRSGTAELTERRACARQVLVVQTNGNKHRQLVESTAFTYAYYSMTVVREQRASAECHCSS